VGQRGKRYNNNVRKSKINERQPGNATYVTQRNAKNNANANDRNRNRNNGNGVTIKHACGKRA